MTVQELIRKMFGRPSRSVSTPLTVAVPAPIPERERQELREAQVRVPRKWAAFDAMIRDYEGGERALRGERR